MGYLLLILNQLVKYWTLRWWSISCISKNISAMIFTIIKHNKVIARLRERRVMKIGYIHHWLNYLRLLLIGMGELKYFICLNGNSIGIKLFWMLGNFLIVYGGRLRSKNCRFLLPFHRINYLLFMSRAFSFRLWRINKKEW